MAIEVKDIKIYRSGRWHPMTNTRYYVNGAWRPFKAGDSVYHNGEWYTLTTKTTIVVYLSPSVRENKDGAMTWHITVATEPDVLSTYEAEISVEMTITMSDGNVYTNVSGTADGDNQYIDTSIPYVEGVDISNLQATATSSNENYTISEVVFTGMYNLLNLENDGTE